MADSPTAEPRQSTLAADIVASVVVFLVALPLCMGIAIASGVSPAQGIITGIVGGIIVGLIAGSPLQVSGPAAGLAVLVFELVQEHGIALLGTVVLGAGALQVVSGMLGFGRWFRAISPSVIQGMLSGIGLLIFASQFHVMLDDAPPGSGLENLITIPTAIFGGLFPLGWDSHHMAATIGVLTISSLLLWERFRPGPLKWIPGSLVAVVVASGTAFSMAMPIVYVEVPNQLSDSFIFPTLGTLSQLAHAPILAEVVAFALIASAETLLCATAVDRMHDGPRTDYNRELTAQGIGNLICGTLGALPMTGVIVRSSANIEAGGKTRLSAILHGVWLLAFVVALPHVLALIPRAGLAAILVYIGIRLINVPALRKLYGISQTELGIAVATIAIIVATDLLTGVLAGVVLSSLKLLYTFSHLEVTETRSEEDGVRRIDVYLDGAATFVRLPTLADTLEGIPQKAKVHLHLGQLAYVDHASLELIGTWQDQFEKNGGNVTIEWDALRARFGWRLALNEIRGTTDVPPPPEGAEDGPATDPAEEQKTPA